MNTKTYYQGNSDFLQGEGVIYTEFMEDIATRQINYLNECYYPSSNLKAWHKNIGYLLYDGKKTDLDLSQSKQISKIDFERIWKKSIANEDLTSYLSYSIGDAATPIHDGILIAHVVNDLGKWGKGFVLSLAKNYPDVKEKYTDWIKNNFCQLGDVQLLSLNNDSSVFLANMLSQRGIKKNKNDNKQYLDYDSLKKCLDKVSDFALKERLEIQCPMFGAGLAGGSWMQVESLILEKICYKKIKCHIVKLS